MKRFLIPIIVVGGLLLLVLLLVRGGGGQRAIDERVTLRQEDKIPFGYYVARQMLPALFPATPVVSDRKAPGAWDGIDTALDNQGLVLVGRSLSADEYEANDILSFAAKGNYVLCIAPQFSDEFCARLRVASSNFIYLDSEDSFEVRLAAPRFTPASFRYPGGGIGGALVAKAADSIVVLGTNGGGRANFLQLRVGTGAVLLHAEPMAFSNYFLLQPGNDKYYQSVFSVMPRGLRKIAWNEYYLAQQRQPEKDPNWLGVLMKQPPFAWALWLIIVLLALYLLSESRRRQRVIPPYTAPRNESLDFVTTVGRLYYDKRDHHNLALKMIQYFLESVRQQYKLNTTLLDADFVARLEARSGYPRPQLQALIDSIHNVRLQQHTTAEELRNLHLQLEDYYQTT